jgi:hypothetical protein
MQAYQQAKVELNILVDSNQQMKKLKMSGQEHKQQNNGLITDPSLYMMGQSAQSAMSTPYCRKKLNFTESLESTTIKVSKKMRTSNAYMTDFDNGGFTVSSNTKQPKSLPKCVSNSKRNARERKRVRTINDYFAQLQKYLPYVKPQQQQQQQQQQAACPNTSQTSVKSGSGASSNANKKLSKVETLKAAIDYIELLLKYAPANFQAKSSSMMMLSNSSSSSSSVSSSSLLSSPASSSTSSLSSSSSKNSSSATTTIFPALSEPCYESTLKNASSAVAASVSTSAAPIISKHLAQYDNNSNINSATYGSASFVGNTTSGNLKDTYAPQSGSYASYDPSYSAHFANFNSPVSSSASSSTSSSSSSVSSSASNSPSCTSMSYKDSYYYNNTNMIPTHNANHHHAHHSQYAAYNTNNHFGKSSEVYMGGETTLPPVAYDYYNSLAPNAAATAAAAVNDYSSGHVKAEYYDHQASCVMNQALDY